MRRLFNGRQFNSSVFNSNLMTIGLMGVLLLLASAVGRVTAANVSGWLAGSQYRAERAHAAAPGRMDMAAHPGWRVR
jgi:hypothetical protein